MSAAREGPLGISLRRREVRLGLFMALPALLLVAGVYVIPAAATLLFSVSRVGVSPLRIRRLAGLENFANAVTGEGFWSIAFRTLYFGALLTAGAMVAAFLIALLLNRPFRGRVLVTVVVLLPWAVPPVVSGVLWTQMFHADFGFINGLLRTFGGEGDIIWLGHPQLALLAVLAAEIWRWIPFASLFLLAGLKTIPPALREAAAIDGAGAWGTFRRITFPLMSPVTIPVAIFLFVWSMKVFDTIFILTRGGPSGNTTTLNYLVYQLGFEQFDFGSASAAAYLLTVLTIAVIAGLGYMRRRARTLTGGGLR